MEHESNKFADVEVKQAFEQARQAQKGRSLGGGQCAEASGPQCGDATQPYPHYRNLVDRLITYHNRQSVQLHALLRALPQEMSREAEQALYDLAKAALGDIR